jgi:hypothetical protein
MKKIIFILAIAFTGISYFSCRHDPILPEHQVSYATEIFPIISSNCWHSGCHNSDSLPQSVSFMTHDDLVRGNYVVPGKPHDSKIFNAVTGLAGQELMPKDYPVLTDRNIRLIYIWIAQGALNN